ncbi:MAG: PilZ domain-containing protein [Planctomycetes bacterium]|nr:PilZ domain-containing protein [Planctomycetota bacterium]
MVSQPSPRPSNSAGSAADRRRWARAQSDLPITVAVAGSKNPARVRDVSRAGVCFFLDRPIPLMTVLEVTLEMKTAKGKQAIHGHGAVVRCERIAKGVEHFEIAVFLHEMSEADRGLMEAYVGTRPPQP